MGKKTVLAFLLISAAINIALLILIYRSLDEVKSAADFNAQQQRYPLLSKRVLQEYPQDLLLNFLDLRNELHDLTEPYGNSFGMYFEYLPTGTSISINSNDEFYAASLFKVPIIMAYYHARERTHEGNDPVLVLKKDQIDNEFGSLWKKGAGYKMKASEAVRLALTESDNTAIKTLVPFVTDEDFNAVYEALDLDLHADQKGASVSARSYSSILKALYFSSTLTKDNSEYILDLLARTKFSDKIVAGVPGEVLVAHKIGDFNDKNGNVGFRDCGIVYVPRRPYIICMVAVGSEQLANDRMQIVSKTIYDYISQTKR